MPTDSRRDPVLGQLTWDEQLNCWLGEAELRPGFDVEFTVDASDDGFATARASLAWLRANESEARRLVSAEMVEVYNDGWTDEDEPITVAEFANRISLNSVSFGDDGSLLLSYDDGPTSMFGGHIIDAEFGPDKAFRDAGLIG